MCTISTKNACVLSGEVLYIWFNNALLLFTDKITNKSSDDSEQHLFTKCKKRRDTIVEEVCITARTSQGETLSIQNTLLFNAYPHTQPFPSFYMLTDYTLCLQNSYRGDPSHHRPYIPAWMSLAQRVAILINGIVVAK